MIQHPDVLPEKPTLEEQDRESLLSCRESQGRVKKCHQSEVVQKPQVIG